MEYTQEITLDLNSNAAYTTVGAKQGDNNSRIITVHIVEDGIPYNLRENGVDSAYFRFRKPDGKAVINPTTLDLDNNTITVVFTSQTLIAAGRGYGDITLMTGSTILSTVSFIVVIMASPQVASEAVSSNEFGYLNAVVEDATHTIYEAQAWATGQRGSQDVYGQNGWEVTFQSPRIISIQHSDEDFEKFLNQVGSNPGLQRIFTFTYQNDNVWSLDRVSIEGNTRTEFLPELITRISDYLTIIYYAGYEEPAPGNTITVNIQEADNAFENNAKYYSDLANSYKESIENLTATGEKIYADEFESTENYTTGTYVWHNNYLYRFINDHSAGVWNDNDVVQEWLINKTLSEQEITNLHFRLPQGKTGNVYYMTFDINFDNNVDLDEGCLYMYRPTAMTDQVNFELGTSGVDEGSLLMTLNNLNYD